MKTIVILVAGIALISVSCRKKERGDMTVIRDCTGVYLRNHNIDHRIINEKELERFENGAEINAKIVPDKNCKKDEEPHCMMLHEHKTSPARYHVSKID